VLENKSLNVRRFFLNFFLSTFRKFTVKKSGIIIRNIKIRLIKKYIKNKNNIKTKIKL